jgi:hypothetical protein
VNVCLKFVCALTQTLHPAWEDVGTKACKLGVQLKATITCLAAFIDSLQKVADHATATKGMRCGLSNYGPEVGQYVNNCSCMIARSQLCDVISLDDGRVGHSRTNRQPAHLEQWRHWRSFLFVAVGVRLHALSNDATRLLLVYLTTR